MKREFEEDKQLTRIRQKEVFEMKRKIFLVFLALAIAIFFISCAVGERITQPTSRVDTGVAPSKQLPPYTGQKARIAVGSFEWKVGGRGGTTTIRGVGDQPIVVEHQSSCMSGLRDMLSTVLVQSGRYRVLERQQLAAIQEEVALTEKGYAEKESGIKRGQIKGADLLITGAVTGWDPGTTGVKAGGGFGVPGLITGIGGAFRKSTMAMDIRIVDVTTSEVLAATRVEGSATDIKLGALAGALIGNVGLAGGLGVYAKTPMEKAIRTCINEAVNYIVSTTPPAYYKY